MGWLTLNISSKTGLVVLNVAQRSEESLKILFASIGFRDFSLPLSLP